MTKPPDPSSKIERELPAPLAQLGDQAPGNQPGSPLGKPPGKPTEHGGPKGPEPTRYGDWERNGRCSDF
jgi:hypothetical protein